MAHSESSCFINVPAHVTVHTGGMGHCTLCGKAQTSPKSGRIATGCRILAITETNTTRLAVSVLAKAGPAQWQRHDCVGKALGILRIILNKRTGVA